jgi:hypothetical protein
MALPGALMLASMMLTTSAAWLEASSAQARHASSIHEQIRATQAADGALSLCARDALAGLAPVLPLYDRGPAEWSSAATFDGAAAYEPVASWAGSARAPQCWIAAVQIEGNADADARIYQITARGFGAQESVQAWLQLTIMREAGRERRAWRRLVSASASASAQAHPPGQPPW